MKNSAVRVFGNEVGLGSWGWSARGLVGRKDEVFLALETNSGVDGVLE